MGDGAVTVVMVLRADEATRAVWEGEFELRHRVRFSRRGLGMELIAKNVGEKAFGFEECCILICGWGTCGGWRWRG